MNRNRSYSLPVVLYTLLLLAVWILSWVLGLVTLFSGEEVVDAALASTDGVRWFLRTSPNTISSLPWGTIVMLLVASGLLYGSGLPGVLLRLSRGESTVRARRALWAALLAFAVAVLPLLSATAPPFSLAKAVDGSFAGSPLSNGMISVLFVVALFVSVGFGVVFGTFRSIKDVVEAACCRIRFHASSLLALLPAALLLSAIDYACPALMQNSLWSGVVRYVILLFPFLYSLFLRPKSEK